MGQRDSEGKRRRILLQEGMSVPIEKKGMSAKGEQPVRPSPPQAPSDLGAPALPDFFDLHQLTLLSEGDSGRGDDLPSRRRNGDP